MTGVLNNGIIDGVLAIGFHDNLNSLKVRYELREETEDPVFGLRVDPYFVAVPFTKKKKQKQ